MEQAEELGRGEPHHGQAPSAAGPVPVARLRAAGSALAVIAVVLIPVSRLAAGTADTDALALVGASLVAMLLVASAWLDVVVWRLTRDPRSVYLAAAALSLAAVPVVLGVVVPGLTEFAVLDRARPADRPRRHPGHRRAHGRGAHLGDARRSGASGS